MSEDFLSRIERQVVEKLRKKTHAKLLSEIIAKMREGGGEAVKDYLKDLADEILEGE